MQPVTVLHLITLALEEVGALDGAFNEAPRPAEANRALVRLNFMLGSWSGTSLMARGTISEAFPLTAGKSAYTIGIGGDFNTSKPMKVTGGFVRDQYGVDTPIGTIQKMEYDGLQDKLTSPARPVAVCYDPGPTQQTIQLGVIYVYYPPDNSGPYTLFLEQDKTLTSVGLQDILHFEDPYFHAIMYNLAEGLWRPFHSGGEPIPIDITSHAERAKRTIESMNARNVISYVDLPGTRGGGQYNILSDTYNQ
jgi:hypothetical protein